MYRIKQNKQNLNLNFRENVIKIFDYTKFYTKKFILFNVAYSEHIHSYVTKCRETNLQTLNCIADEKFSKGHKK